MKGGPVVMGDGPPNRAEERKLLSRAAAGDENARIDLYEAYFGGVRRAALKVLKSYEEADDIAQDVWIVFQHWLPRLADNPDLHVAAWLYRVAANMSLDRWQDMCRLVSLSDLTPSNAEALVGEAMQGIRRMRCGEDAAEDTVFEREIRTYVQSLLSELEYEVFKSELDGAKPRETAAYLGLPPARVHTLRYRIRDRLRVFFRDIL
jgi:RNA polymerase sigma factor (sigma-70 family)